MSIAVIGAGLMGSAAARHLAQAGEEVFLIGPEEPADKPTHFGVFGSHYDEGRITRKNALDQFWSEVSAASIDRYAQIEAESGIPFFIQSGCLMAGGDTYIKRIEAAGGHGEPLDAEALAHRFPFFRFKPTFTAWFEAKDAGHISPRRLVAAQTKTAMKHGARVVCEVVTGFKERPDHVQIVTPSQTIRVDRVLVAAGYMTDMLLGREPQLDIYARTVALFEVDDAEAARLRDMPSLIYADPAAPYLLPPIRYPDGKDYLKLGGDPEDVALNGEADIHDWFRSQGSTSVGRRLDAMLHELMPGLDVQTTKFDACVTSWTNDRKPEIRSLSARVAVCTGGNGAGAKCSDELGRRGAALVSDQLGEK
ncbi:MAG: FAD-dependent oxidoreductase [Litoreibacter sp.]